MAKYLPWAAQATTGSKEDHGIFDATPLRIDPDQIARRAGSDEVVARFTHDLMFHFPQEVATADLAGGLR